MKTRGTSPWFKFILFPLPSPTMADKGGQIGGGVYPFLTFPLPLFLQILALWPVADVTVAGAV